MNKSIFQSSFHVKNPPSQFFTAMMWAGFEMSHPFNDNVFIVENGICAPKRQMNEFDPFKHPEWKVQFDGFRTVSLNGHNGNFNLRLPPNFWFDVKTEAQCIAFNRFLRECLCITDINEFELHSSWTYENGKLRNEDAECLTTTELKLEIINGKSFVVCNEYGWSYQIDDPVISNIIKPVLSDSELSEVDWLTARKNYLLQRLKVNNDSKLISQLSFVITRLSEIQRFEV